MAINPIGPAGINPLTNIAPMSQTGAVNPAQRTGQKPLSAPEMPEVGKNLAPTNDAGKFGMINLKDVAGDLGNSADLASEALGSGDSIIPQQFSSISADGRMETGSGAQSATGNLEAIQQATGAAHPGGTASLFNAESPEEAANVDRSHSFAIETPEQAINSESAVNQLVNGFNAMTRTANEIGSEKLQGRLDAIALGASAGLSSAGISMNQDGLLSVDSLPSQIDGGSLAAFAENLRGLADEVGQNPAAFMPQGGNEGVLYGANGGALSQISAQMSSIGRLFDAFM
jgi:hypothetical protein